ncbi:MAG: transporter [Pseudomonadota bacterium]|nr:transporter [Pseudomonadota bacterium]
MNITSLIPLTILGLCLSSYAQASENHLHLGAGLDYSTGNYGTSTTTDITSIPLMAQYDTGSWTLKLTVPYLFINGSGNVIPGIGRVNNRNPHARGEANNSTSVQGLGDVVTAATYHFAPTENGFSVDWTGRIKFGTASRDKGLGTGENDYSTEIDVYKGYGRYTIFGGAGYSLLGSSQYIQLNNVANVTFGGLYQVDRLDIVGLSYDGMQKVADTSSPESQVTGFWEHTVNSQMKTQAYILKGLANGSPDWGVGANIIHSF